MCIRDRFYAFWKVAQATKERIDKLKDTAEKAAKRAAALNKGGNMADKQKVLMGDLKNVQAKKQLGAKESIDNVKINKQQSSESSEMNMLSMLLLQGIVKKQQS
eukprot:TRINITY_DN1181_c0_g3_i6.p2 TRINITY_DN1181_c0_g3~~TRINITY_DN1181_c0_g3_i6.p2  ORF type:complete len:104 (+),score=30.98 TRINITY_DN1181_c0_g3_i6:68-379(+)